MTVRVGSGFDVHPFSGDRTLVLGGVEIKGARGLAGHSDADVISHAISDAVLGAAGLGDIGSHFPDDDPRWLNARSVELLTQVCSMAEEAGWLVGNADCTVVLEEPRIFGYRAGVEAALSQAVGAPVTVKAKRAEGLGALGRREGIACWAVVLLEQAS